MSEAQKIAELAVEASAPHVIANADGREYLVVPGHAPKDISEADAVARHLPKTIYQRVTVQTADSLVRYVDRFSEPGKSLLLADIENNTIRGHLDYHAKDDPDFVEHTATLVLPFSQEWKVWTAVSGKMLSQLDFARFIEEHAPDISVPVAADLLETVRDLQGIRKADFRSAIRTASDNESFEYSVENTVTTKSGAVEVPKQFVLSIPVYFGGPAVTLYAFLRHRIDDGALSLGVSLHRAEVVRQAEFQRIVTDVEERTELMAIYGRLGA